MNYNHGKEVLETSHCAKHARLNGLGNLEVTKCDAATINPTKEQAVEVVECVQWLSVKQTGDVSDVKKASFSDNCQLKHTVSKISTGTLTPTIPIKEDGKPAARTSVSKVINSKKPEAVTVFAKTTPQRSDKSKVNVYVEIPLELSDWQSLPPGLQLMNDLDGNDPSVLLLEMDGNCPEIPDVLLEAVASACEHVVKCEDEDPKNKVKFLRKSVYL